MKIESEKVIVIEVEAVQGTSKKTLKPYHFYKMVIADNDLNRFETIVPESALVDGVVPEWLLEAKKVEALADFDITPSREGFGVNMKCTAIEAADH